jgi:hypothetical protein
MTPLFLKQPTINPADYLSEREVAKLAGTRLTSPPAYWDDEITQVLLREHPYLPLDRAIVNFTQRDDGAGCAMGYVSIVGAPRLSIPIVIKNWELSPLDIMISRQDNPADDAADQQGSGDMEDDEVIPLNEDSFTMALDTGTMGEPVPRHISLNTGYSEDGSSLRLPFRGRTVLASYMGASDKAKEKAAAVLSKNAEIVGGFVMNETGDVLDSWLNAPSPKNTVEAKLAAVQINRSHAIVMAIPADLEQMKSAEILAADIFIADESTKTAVAFDAIDLSAPNAKLARWFLFDDGTFSRAQEHVTGFRHSGEAETKAAAAVLAKTATNALRIGQHFVFHCDGIFTAPAKLASMVSRGDRRSVELRMTNDIGAPFTVFLDDRIKVAMHDEQTNAWMFPTSSQVLALGEHQEIPSLTADKVASALSDKLPDQLICSNGQWTLNLRGEPLATQVTEAKIAQLLDSHLDNANELMSIAKEDGSVRFASTLPAQLEDLATKVAQFTGLPKFANEVMGEVQLTMEKGLKLAATIGDPESVDAVLGASFLTEDNLAEFVGLADQFNQTVSKLARLLLAIRMGFPGDETATTVAMKSLSRVAERLQSASAEVSN